MSDDPANQDPNTEATRQHTAARIARIEERSAQFGANLARFDARMEARFNEMKARFDQIDTRFDRMEERLDASIGKLDTSFGTRAKGGSSFDTMNRSIDRVFRLLIVVSAIMAVIMAKGFHWI